MFSNPSLSLRSSLPGRYSKKCLTVREYQAHTNNSSAGIRKVKSTATFLWRRCVLKHWKLWCYTVCVALNQKPGTLWLLMEPVIDLSCRAALWGYVSEVYFSHSHFFDHYLFSNLLDTFCLWYFHDQQNINQALKFPINPVSALMIDRN